MPPANRSVTVSASSRSRSSHGRRNTVALPDPAGIVIHRVADRLSSVAEPVRGKYTLRGTVVSPVLEMMKLLPVPSTTIAGFDAVIVTRGVGGTSICRDAG